jgi:anti-sigma-K factor RskA
MTTDVHTLSGAYALDALSEEEAAEFREHLRGCQACRDEVRELRQAAARMGAADSLAPPPALRARVLASAARTPQQPPVVTTLASRRPRRTRRWLAGVAAAAVLVGGGVAGVSALRGNDEPGLAPGAAQVFAAPDVKALTVDTANGGKLKVGISRDEGDMAVDTRGLPQLDDAHSYQLWSIQNGVAKSVTVFSPEDTGASMPLPPAETKVAITIEPHGGSDEPTTTPIAELDPTAV